MFRVLIICRNVDYKFISVNLLFVVVLGWVKGVLVVCGGGVWAFYVGLLGFDFVITDLLLLMG